jgi:hypothetical protein
VPGFHRRLRFRAAISLLRFPYFVHLLELTGGGALGVKAARGGGDAISLAGAALCHARFLRIAQEQALCRLGFRVLRSAAIPYNKKEHSMGIVSALQWQRLFIKGGGLWVGSIARTPVASGWLVATRGFLGSLSGITFVPDHEHRWDGNSVGNQERPSGIPV